MTKHENLRTACSRMRRLDPSRLRLSAAVSADQKSWRDVEYEMRVTGSEGGWHKLRISGEIDDASAPQWFKLTIRPGPLSPDHVQLGRVELRGDGSR